MLTTLYQLFHDLIFELILAYARLAVIFYMLPILGERLLSNALLKNTVIYLVIIGLWPVIDGGHIIRNLTLMNVLSECVIGLFLAMVLCVPFWIVMMMGEIFDNQRGASMSESIDPVNGGQASVLSAFLNFTFCTIFFMGGGMVLLMQALVKSYAVYPLGSSLITFHWEQAGALLMLLARESLLISAPVIIVMAITEVLLGAFSRYCAQLNPFSISMSVKSFVAFLLLLLYGFRALSEKSIVLFTQLISHPFST